ncbi:MAG: RNA polymerase sigma factor FliA [Gammaproteobacteria bacterium]
MTNAALPVLTHDTRDRTPLDHTTLRYGPLVNQVALHLMKRLPASVDVDDLTQAGMIGLLEASKNYDPSRGASFETYAKIRIRGAMLDEVRKGHWAPRSLYRKVRQMAQAVGAIEAQNKRDAKDDEVAKQMQLDISEYHRLLRQVSEHKILSLDDMPADGEEFSQAVADTAPNPQEQFENQRLKSALTQEIAALPAKEALVMALYYDEELNMREIGEVLGITESRVSQLRSQALGRLRSRMGQWLG